MENIYYLLFICLLFWYFIHLRRISEFAKKHAHRYCDKENLQFLAIARESSRFKMNSKYGPHWLSTFSFEFSGDGESSYHAHLTMRGYKMDHIDVPPYRVH